MRSSTLNMWMNSVKIMRLAAQAWIERMSQPNWTSAIRNWTDS